MNNDQTKDTKQRIIKEALILFVKQGYSSTSTRQIAKNANVNLSSIKYYFGDKAGLYRTVYKEPLNCSIQEDIIAFTSQHTLQDSLSVIFDRLLLPLKESPDIDLCIRLHMREMAAPTGVWEDKIQNEISPHHNALVSVIQKELEHIDINILHRLAFSIIGMGVFLYTGWDAINHTKSDLLNSHEAIDEWKKELVNYSISMINTHIKKANQ